VAGQSIQKWEKRELRIAQKGTYLRRITLIRRLRLNLIMQMPQKLLRRTE